MDNTQTDPNNPPSLVKNGSSIYVLLAWDENCMEYIPRYVGKSQEKLRNTLKNKINTDFKIGKAEWIGD